MQTARTLVLLDLTPEASDLADCLVAAGHDVILADWHARRLAGTAGTAPWPDVLVTDRRALGDTDPLLAAEIVSQQVGIVAIGTNLAADVTLPADVQGRELILAVDLVTRLVRLRRTHQDVDQDRRRWIDLAMHDPLTGLPNRRAWQQELERRLAAGGPLGLALIDHSPWVYLVVLPSFALAFFCIVRAEEDFLRRRFGEAYEAYCSEVPRFLPRWKGLGTTFSASRFHWRRVVAKDYGTAFSWTTAALVLLAAERVRWFGAQAARAELAAIGAVWSLLAAAWATARWLKKRGSLREPSAGAAGQAEPPSLAPPGSGQRR